MNEDKQKYEERIRKLKERLKKILYFFMWLSVIALIFGIFHTLFRSLNPI